LQLKLGRKMKILQLSTILCGILATTSLIANDTTIYQMDVISVSASPIHDHEAFDVPNQVDVIQGANKTLKATASLGAILEDISGVNNISTGTQAGKPVVRGMTGERVKVISNGSPTDSQTYGIRHVLNTDPFIADRIEVIRGAQGVLYGSDALGGVVNILSPEILTAPEGKSIAKGEVAGEYHTNNTERMGGVKIQAASGKLGVNAAISKRKAGNFSTPDANTWDKGEVAGNEPRFAGELPYTNFDTTSAQVAIGYTDNWGRISAQHTYWESFQNYLGHTSRPQGTALTNFDYSAVASAGQKLTNNETQLKGEFLLGEWIFKPTLARTLNQRKAATNTPYEIMETKKGTADYLNIEVDRYDGRLAFEHPKVGNFKGEIAIEGFDKDQTLIEGKLSPTASEKGNAIYLFEEADYEKWILQAGLRYDTKRINAPTDGTNSPFVTAGIFNPSNNSQEFNGFSGSLGAVYHLTSRWNLAGNIARGFRAPSIFELYAGGIHGGVQAYQLGNPDLNAETTWGADVALRYKDDKTKASLGVYHTIINDYIYLANTGRNRDPQTGVIVSSGGIPEMKNQQTDATMQGIEFSFDTFITDSTRIDGGFELIRGRDTTNDLKLTMMPANNLRLALHQDVGSLGIFDHSTFSITMKSAASASAAGPQEPFAQYNDKTKFPFGSADTAGYTVWGLGCNANINMGTQKAQLGIKVTNLFDKEYRDFLDTYKGYALAIGRDVSFTLTLPFEI
jgi:iron complex outermembrane receptor protein